MGNLQEDQILLYEELCGYPVDERDQRVIATKRFRENLRLVYYITNRFSYPIDPAMSKEDILQSGYEGLWLACLSFDESKGYNFSTYAIPMIKGTILSSLSRSEPIKTSRVHKSIRKLLKETGYTIPLSEDEVYDLICLSEGKISRDAIMKFAEPSILDLGSPVPGTENAVLADIIPAPEVEYELSEDEIERAIDAILIYLKPANRDMIEEWMYATLAGVKITQRELGEKYGITQSRVNFLIHNAINIVSMHRDEILDIFGR